MPVSMSVQSVLPLVENQKIKSVLDYGTGTLRNARYLLEHGLRVYVLDIPERMPWIKAQQDCGFFSGIYTPEDLTNLRLETDLVICNFVLNIIENSTERFNTVKRIYANLREGGFFLAEVRPKLKISTFKAYTPEELDELVLPAGFKKRKYLGLPKSLAILYQK